jgi:2-aminoadipate transaminase
MNPAASSDAPITHLLSRRARDLPAPRMGDPRESAELISFFAGFPDPGSLPTEEIIAATTVVLRREGEWALQYGNGRGYPGLADAILAKLQRDQGITASRDQILITAGASQALGLVIDAVIDWGDTVITEAPTWSGAVRAFQTVGARAVSVPVDEEGTDTAALESRLAELREAGVTPKFIYVISNFQNPSGVSTTLARRERIVELAHEYETLILEDDAYADLRYEGENIPSLFTLDERGTTLSLGTLSKTLGAGMRLGWVLGNPALIGKLAVLKIDGGTNVFGSHVAAEWLPRHLAAHVAHLRSIYHRRRDLMLASLERHMPDGVTWTRPEGGFFIWVTLPEGVDTTRLLPQAKECGVEFLPGRSCYVDDRGANELRLSYSFARDDQIDEGIRIIAEIVRGEIMESSGPSN